MVNKKTIAIAFAILMVLAVSASASNVVSLNSILTGNLGDVTVDATATLLIYSVF